MKKIIYITLLLFLFIKTSAQESIISGTIPEYAGKELRFTYYSDFITNEIKEAGKVKVAENGEFYFKLNSEDVVDIHIVDGIYDGSLLAEPGREYDIKLPLPEKKSFNEICNPFFEEIKYYIGYTDTVENDLNFKIQDIERDLGFFISENYNNFIFGIPPRQKVDSFIDVFNRNYHSNNKYLNDFINYKIGYLKYISRYSEPEEIASVYFYNSPVLYNNESYFTLFNNIFKNFFKSFPHQKKVESYGSIINYGKGLSVLIENISSNLELSNKPLIELLIIKGLYDGFHSGDYDSKSIIPILDSIIVYSKNPKSILIAENTKKSINHLLTGSQAPDFELYDQDSVLIKLSKFKGKYIYLNFCTNKNMTSRRELSLIPPLKKKFKRDIEFITISVDDSFDDFKKFCISNNYDWIIVGFGNQPEILNEYKVRSFPTGFLIDPYGKLILVPALLPSEGFENQFYGILNKRN